MGLRADVISSNYQIMRQNLHEGLDFPAIIGQTTTKTVSQRNITARTVDGDSHFVDDIQSICELVKGDIQSSYADRKQKAEVAYTATGYEVTFTIKRIS